ncbi:hypothetical protein ACO0QE_004675 [Hanseniaspora vineae]
MASQNDLFDMLNISKQHDPNSAESVAETSVETHKRPVQLLQQQQHQPNQQMLTGIQKELYNLMGDTMPPTMLTSNKKQHSKLSASKASPWMKQKFKPLADSKVVLEHWVRGTQPQQTNELATSKFATYNHTYTVPTFSAEEFYTFMNIDTQEDSSNTPNRNEVGENKEEFDGKKDTTVNEPVQAVTKHVTPKTNSELKSDGALKNSLTFDEVQYLFDLVKAYDMKWIVIHDRYEFAGKERTIEDLKDMFYLVCQKYFSHKEPNNTDLQKLLSFPKEKEIQRKKYLSRLLSRTSAEVAEEEALVIEAKKFEMAAKKTSIEREQLLQLLDSPVPLESIDITEFMTSQGLYNFYCSLMGDKTRKRRYDAVPENPWMKQQQRFKTQKTKKFEDDSEFGVPSTEDTPGRSSVEVSQPENIITQLLHEFDQDERKNLGIRLHENKLSPGVFLRSTKISSFKPATQNKVQAVLNEMKIPLRPVMPTFDVIKKNDELLKKITHLLELKKQVDKLEAELKIRK